MHLAPRHGSLALLVAAHLACAPADPPLSGGDASAVDATDDALSPSDAPRPDAPPPVDAQADAPPASPDASTRVDATAAPGDVPADVAAPRDVASPGDAPATTDVVAPRDVTATTDVVAPRDVTATTDVVAPNDAAAPRDVVATADVVAPRDVAAAGDVVATADAGPCATARVIAPAAAEAIETCSESGAPVFYTFRADVTGAPTRVDFAFRTPGGDLAPPAPAPLTAAPWSVRRQVGGMMTDAPPLAVFPNALRGTWNLDVTVTDRCGRTTVSQPFTLTFTTRRCPNP